MDIGDRDSTIDLPSNPDRDIRFKPDADSDSDSEHFGFGIDEAPVPSGHQTHCGIDFTRNDTNNTMDSGSTGTLLQRGGASKLKNALRALRHRNYRLFFAGQLISLVGTWMQMIAQSWLVYRLTGSSFLLGAIGFASQIPIFLLAFVGGTIADRYNRHRVVIATQAASMILALIFVCSDADGNGAHMACLRPLGSVGRRERFRYADATGIYG